MVALQQALTIFCHIGGSVVEFSGDRGSIPRQCIYDLA